MSRLYSICIAVALGCLTGCDVDVHERPAATTVIKEPPKDGKDIHIQTPRVNVEVDR